MGRSSKAKGAKAEAEWRNILREKLGDLHDFFRGRQAGSTKKSADVFGLPGWWQEVKRQERLALPQWLAQAEADAAEAGQRPVVVFRQSHQPWRVVLKAMDWIAQIRREAELQAEVERLQKRVEELEG